MTNKNGIKIEDNKSYWTYNVIYMPIEVKIIDINIKANQAKIDQGWIDIDRLYNSEESCPQR